MFRRAILLIGLFLPALQATAVERLLPPGPSPADNPRKGLVPYEDAAVERFPHSLEFSYLPVSDVVVGPASYDDGPIERLLDRIADRGCQAVLRFYLEYPGQPSGVPKYLLDDGVRLTRWREDGNRILTPDYDDPRLRACILRFIEWFGDRYDGDPRLGYLTAGLLGHWGEWHSYPRDELFPGRQFQREVLDAFERSLPTTPVLLRYPAGEDDDHYAANHRRPFGFHDDSFAYATLATGREEDSWYFESLLSNADATERWRRHPIGGEIRPEVWGRIFDAPDRRPKRSQDFDQCVRRVHATWLMDTGMFETNPSEDRRRRATESIRKMGYDFRVHQITIDDRTVTIDVINQGVAPFYADWPTELMAVDGGGREIFRQTVDDFSLAGRLPSAEPHRLRATFDVPLPVDGVTWMMRVVHPLDNGKPLRFANADQDRDRTGWLTLLPR